MLTGRKIRFVNLIADFVPQAEAYLKAGFSENGAASGASRLVHDSEVIAAVVARRELLAEIAGIDATWILHKYKEIAEADPNELVAVRRVNCRHCWGLQHEYQWTELEYRHAVDAALDAKEPRIPPAASGGFGYDGKREPAADCPACHGEGMELVHIADTRKLKGSARRLYAGAKQTKDGIEIKLRDQDAALKFLADYKGMVIRRGEFSGPGGGPVPVANLTADDFTDEELATILRKPKVDKDVIGD